MSRDTFVYMPDGSFTSLPPNPSSYVDASAGVRGSSLRAPVMTADVSAAVTWHRQRPLFQASQALAQSIPSSTWTTITGLNELIDNYAGHSDTSNTGRYYAPSTASGPASGDYYLCSGYIPYNVSDAAHVFIAGLRKNSTATPVEGGKIASGAGHANDVLVIDLVQLDGSASDYIELAGWQNTGSAVNTAVSTKGASLTVRWVAADPAGTHAFAPALPGTPHTWTSADTWTADATGGAKVPMNRECRDIIRYLNNPPIARLTASGTAQTIPTGSGTWTSINYTASGNVDTYSGWAIGNPSRYVCQRAGLYLVAGQATVAETASNAGYRAVRLLQTIAAGGTATYAGWAVRPVTTATTGTSIYAIAMVRMAAGDYIETQMQHTQGASLSVGTSATGAPRMIAVWMAK
jgi:hypothetical protein